jgi:hypothetical protein
VQRLGCAPRDSQYGTSGLPPKGWQLFLFTRSNLARDSPQQFIPTSYSDTSLPRLCDGDEYLRHRLHIELFNSNSKIKHICYRRPFARCSLPSISAFKSSTAPQVARFTVWRADCTSSSVGSRKTKNSKETQDHGEKDSEKGKEARISEASQLSRASSH